MFPGTRPLATRLRASVLLAGLAALAACTDHNPAGAPDGPVPLPPSALAAVACTVSVADGAVRCGGGDGVSVPGVNAAVIGGQGVYVRLASSGAGYDGADTFHVSVTVENLTPQALGTADGQTPSPAGVRIFFASGPTTTGGSGSVSVANADGEAFFSAAGQPYFQYDGVLAPGDTSAAKEWRFSMPKTVTRFGFVVYVAAPVPMEGGWLSVSPLAPSMQFGQGDTVRLDAILRNVAGGVVAGGPVTWSSSDSSIVSVDGQGMLSGLREGVATVTATRGGRTASVIARVDHSMWGPVPVIRGLEVARRRAAGDGVDSLVFRASSAGRHGPSDQMRVLLSHPRDGTLVCSTGDPAVADGERAWRCAVALPRFSSGGAWQVDELSIGNRVVTGAQLAAAGAPVRVYVEPSAGDGEAPTLDSLRILSDTVILGQDAFRMTVIARDNVQMDNAEAWISSPGNPRSNVHGYPVSVRPDGSVVMQFQSTLPAFWRSATFSLDSLFLRDRAGNERTVYRAELQAAGFGTTFTAIGLNPDTVPPRITAFSLSPDTVRAGTDTVTVTLSATEPDGEGGVWYMDMELRKADDATRTRYCDVVESVDHRALTLTCPFAFDAADAGTWRVRYVRAVDAKFLQRVLFTADLQAAGYPTELVVTAP